MNAISQYNSVKSCFRAMTQELHQKESIKRARQGKTI